MNNLKELNPVPNGIQTSSEDPLGFIYPTYRAAGTEASRDKHSLKSSHQGVAYVSSSVGGSVSTLSFQDTTPSNYWRPPMRRAGGIRDRVRGFSRASRRNLLRRLASINRSAFRAFRGRIIFVTLPYPDEYPEDPELCKRHLKAFRKRLQREYKSFAALWRLGIQQRGAWHFHLLLFVEPAFGPIGELRHFISSSWYEVTGKVSEGHLRAGTLVETIRKWKQATSYVERYMAKPEVFPEGLQTRVNEALVADIPPSTFVTCFYGVLDPKDGHLSYANAGHNLPCRRHDGQAEELRARGMPLGLMPGRRYEEKETILTSGDSTLFYSDGLVEAHDPQGEMFGFPRLRALIGEHGEERALGDFLLEQLYSFVGEGWEQEDDITLLTLKRSASLS
jgi:hypothetical protein